MPPWLPDSMVQGTAAPRLNVLRLMLPIVLTTALEVPKAVASRARRAVVVGGATSGAAALANVALGQPASAARRPRDDSSYEVRRTRAEWSAALSEQQYFVLREGGTEPKFSSTLLSEKAAGTYRCAGCDAPLFDSRQKFDSGTGWPSFANALPAVEVARHATAFKPWANRMHACIHAHARTQTHSYHGAGRAPSPRASADGGARRRGALRRRLYAVEAAATRHRGRSAGVLVPCRRAAAGAAATWATSSSTASCGWVAVRA